MIYIIFLIIVLLCIYFLRKRKTTKKSSFWKNQPIQRTNTPPPTNKSKLFPPITNKPPKPIIINNFICKEIPKHNIIKTISSINELAKNEFDINFNINQYLTYSKIHNTRMFILDDYNSNHCGMIFAIPTNQLYYVSGLYILPSYRNKNLSSMLISHLVKECWYIKNQFLFIHDLSEINKSPLNDTTICPFQIWDITDFIFHPWLYNFSSTHNKSKNEIYDISKLIPTFSNINSLHPNNISFTTKNTKTTINYRIENNICIIISSNIPITFEIMNELYETTHCYLYQSPNVFIQPINTAIFGHTHKRIAFLYNVSFNPNSTDIYEPFDSL